jgi:alpha-1,2-mannosyltransferase
VHRANWKIAAATAAYVVSAAICCAPLVSQVHLVDLHVYRMGGDAVLHGSSLYSLRFAGQLPFTYPPFAALLFTVLAWLPWAPAAVLLTAATVATLPVMLYLALRLPGSPPIRGRGAAWELALAAAAAAIWLEPVHSTLFYGQVDVFIACAVLYHLTLPDTSPIKGTAIGLAAAFKLTPAIFAVYLLLTRRYRAAATAAAVFASTVALGFAVLPGDSAYFWDISFLRPGRVSPPQNTQNQSLLGAISRTFHTTTAGLPWLLPAMLVALTGLVLAVRACRGGDEAHGFSLCAVTELLVSPISWTHHWVLAVPALLLAILAIYRHRTRHPLAAIPAAIAAIAIAVIGWGRVARHVPNGGWLRLPASAIIKSEVYVIIGLGVLVTAAIAELIGYSRARSNNGASQTPQLSPSNESLQSFPLPTASPPTSSLPSPEV